MQDSQAVGRRVPIDRSRAWQERERAIRDLARIAVITAYPEEDWHSQRLFAAAKRQGHAQVLAPTDFSAHLENGRTVVRAHGQDVLGAYDLLLTPRALGEAGDHDFQLELYRLLKELGGLLVNEVGALLAALDKFRSSVLFERAGLPTPPTAVVQRPEEAAALLETWGSAVGKPLFGSLGEGVRLLLAKGTSRTELGRICREHRALYLQRFVPGCERDIRAFVVGDRVIAAIYRYPAPGAHPFAVHHGGRVEIARLSRGEEALAVAAAHAVGLDYTGVDLLEGPGGPVVIEVNGTPRWEKIHAATGRDVADDIVEHARSLIPRAALQKPPPAPAAYVPSRGDASSAGASAAGTTPDKNRMKREEHNHDGR